jgi:hypothetical protein
MQYEQAHVFQTARAPAGWGVESSGQGAAARPWGAGRGRLGIDPQALGGILPPPARRTPTWTSRWQLAAGTAAGANEQQPCRQCNRGDIGAAQPLFLCASSPKFIAGYVSSQLPTSSCFPISFCGGISRHIYRRSHRRMSRSLGHCHCLFVCIVGVVAFQLPPAVPSPPFPLPFLLLSGSPHAALVIYFSFWSLAISGVALGQHGRKPVAFARGRPLVKPRHGRDGPALPALPGGGGTGV